jgi:hypothetical protein
MIDSIEFAAGRVPGGSAVTVAAGKMTVLVGPNNSGKSQALREIYSSIRFADFRGSVVRLVRLAYLPDDLAEAVITDFAQLTTRPPQLADRPVLFQDGSEWLSLRAPRTRNHPDDNGVVDGSHAGFKKALTGVGGPYGQEIHRRVVAISTLQLDGGSRLALMDETDQVDLSQPAPTALHRLQESWGSRQELRERTYEAFERYVQLDYSGGQGRARWRIGRAAPSTEEEETSRTARRVDAVGRMPLLIHAGDGIKAFTGITAMVLSSPFRILLIDEPEAFLAPPLQRRLGALLVHEAQRRNGHVIVATHSPDFLTGAIQAGGALNVVRLTYDEPVATARALESTKLRPLVRRPVLRSAGVLSAAFHHGAVITESDGDRVLYNEINDRLREAVLPHAVDTIFLNGQGRTSLEQIAPPLRDLGIPAAIVADLDVIRPKQIEPLMRAAGVDPSERARLSAAAAAVAKSFAGLAASGQSEYDVAKAGGLKRLKGSDLFQAQRLLDEFATYGLFLVPVGELEHWLSGVAPLPGGKKAEWISQTLEKLGEDPADPLYVRPHGDDVWQFVQSVANWIRNPARRGMPS